MAYTKKTWVTGETIQAVDLNHLENGVEAISANGAIGTANLAANAVTSAKIANNSITEDELADGAVVTAKIEDGAVTNAKIATAAVSGTQIADETITATNIADETLTEAKLDPTFAASLAKVDGSYELLTSGNAYQLVSTVGVENNAPYVFRTTGGAADVGDRMNLKAVVGGTVALNQLVQNGNFNGNTDGWNISGSATKSVSNNVLTLTSSAISSSYQTLPLANANGHRILFCGTVSATASAQFGIYKNSSGTYATGINPADGTKVRTERIITLSATSTDVFDIRFRANTADSTTITAENVNVFDLTAMFGSAIADYIYSLEQANTGAGVAYFHKLFPKPYYQYAAANLQSVKTSAHRTVGFNQWDEEWQNGYYVPTTGAFSANNQYICSKNPIHVFPATTYYIKTSGVAFEICEYDANGVFLRQLRSSLVDATFTTDSDTHYIQIGSHTSGAMTNYDPTAKPICINLHWDGERDGEYEPYEAHTYALDDVELRGILKLDASNNLYYDGDEYTPDGTVTRRYGIVDLGTLTWTTIATRAYIKDFASTYNAKTPRNAQALAQIITEKYTQIASTATLGEGQFAFLQNGSLYFYRSGDTPTGYMVFELGTSTTETADAYTELQICSDWGVEEFVDAATRDFDMPVGNVAVYAPNLRAKVEMAPNSPDTDGDYLMRHSNGTNEYVLFSTVKELPDMPTTDGTYKLRCTVSSGTATLTWVSE